jgi:hypothetical protein
MTRSPLDGLRPPRPAPELRDRVLGAALAAEAQAGWIDRVWASRELRFATAASIAALVLAHLALEPAPLPVRIAPPEPVLVEGIAIPRAARESGPSIAGVRELELEAIR